jgi:hypothetical protein
LETDGVKTREYIADGRRREEAILSTFEISARLTSPVEVDGDVVSLAMELAAELPDGPFSMPMSMALTVADDRVVRIVEAVDPGAGARLFASFQRSCTPRKWRVSCSLDDGAVLRQRRAKALAQLARPDGHTGACQPLRVREAFVTQDVVLAGDDQRGR